MQTEQPSKRVCIDEVPGVPSPLAHKSIAVVSQGVVYVSGQLGKGEDGRPLPTVEAQVQQALDQIERILAAAGSDLQHVLRMGVYATDIAHLLVVSDAVRQRVPLNPPANFGVQVSGLALGADVEIEVVAAVA